jgi:hypothetical protein
MGVAGMVLGRKQATAALVQLGKFPNYHRDGSGVGGSGSSIDNSNGSGGAAGEVPANDAIDRPSKVATPVATPVTPTVTPTAAVTPTAVVTQTATQTVTPCRLTKFPLSVLDSIKALVQKVVESPTEQAKFSRIKTTAKKVRHCCLHGSVRVKRSMVRLCCCLHGVHLKWVTRSVCVKPSMVRPCCCLHGAHLKWFTRSVRVKMLVL